MSKRYFPMVPQCCTEVIDELIRRTESYELLVSYFVRPKIRNHFGPLAATFTT